MARTLPSKTTDRASASSSTYQFRPRNVLKRARWNMFDDGQSSSSEENDLSDDDGASISSASDDSTAATSDAEYVGGGGGGGGKFGGLSDEEDEESSAYLDSSDEEWGVSPSKRKRRRGGKGRMQLGARRRTLALPGMPAGNSPSKDKLRILSTISHAPNTLPARPKALDMLPSEELAAMTAHQRAKRVLHVGATPESLPCREEQFEEVMACLEDAVEEGLGGCVYVSGVPGTGKTATVREVIRRLQQREEGKPFNFVEINGMKLQDAHDAYSVLWHALTGLRASNGVALYQLSRHFGTRLHSNKSKDRHQKKRARMEHEADEDDEVEEVGRPTTVVLLDELDQMVTARQDVMYNFFNWPNGPDSRLVVVAVANTMDLPERILHAKVASRLGMTRITFRPYNDRQLVEIVQARLDAAAHQGVANVFAPDALVYLAKRVSNVSGDARRMLDVCRRAIDAATESGERSISIGDMKIVLDAMVKSGKGAHVAHLALHVKVALVAVLLCVRRAGMAEVDLATITATHLSLCRMHAIPLPATVDASKMADLGRLAVVANVVAQLCCAGLVIPVGSGVASAKSGKFARYVLACSEDEARFALEQDSDVRLRSML